jgi:Ca2+-binding EF-hand superfamily protein
VSATFQQFDANKDGGIDLGEFVRVTNMNTKILAPLTLSLSLS